MKRHEFVREKDGEIHVREFDEIKILDMIQEGKNFFDAGWNVRIIEIEETVLVEFTH